jgi:hypothetical protein
MRDDKPLPRHDAVSAHNSIQILLCLLPMAPPQQLVHGSSGGAEAIGRHAL